MHKFHIETPDWRIDDEIVLNLIAEIERLEADLTAIDSTFGGMKRDWEREKKRADMLEAENAKLRAGWVILQEITDENWEYLLDRILPDFTWTESLQKSLRKVQQLLMGKEAK